MWTDRVSNPEPDYESGALPTALRGPAYLSVSATSKPAAETVWDTLADAILLV